ncbi:hypothetical protein BU16DRAFT_505789 [Lophium mytilinum]|uniref:Uncharacterized protein n=1 Tax=Lophium mytilinum TaxID=390894 RepID=A0A6A6QZB1_9PEZI|nr:hypothetical protein BU16DRAFT_505789 [Lophium mytilinum]
MAPPGTGASKKGQKQVFKLDSPFTETIIPPIADNDKDIILDMLCNLLTPIGRHRSTHIPPSKGRSNRISKRKRAAQDPPSVPSQEPPPPPPPALSAHLTIGLNATTRHLEALAAQYGPSLKSPAKRSEAEQPAPPRALALVLIPHPNPPSSLIHAHIPTLVALSSPPRQSSSGQESEVDKVAAERQPARLVSLPTSSEARLASALHLPRLSALGILEGAPGADALIEFVRQRVAFVEVGWLREAGLEEVGEGGGWGGIKVKVSKEGGGKET